MRRRISTAMLAALSLSLTACGSGSTASTTAAATEAAAAATEPADASNENERGTGDQYSAAEAGEHAIDADGFEASYDNISVTKAGDSEEGDEADFYGTNAAVIAQNGGSLEITNARIDSQAAYGNAVFSYGEGSNINISDSTITTTEHNSGGIMVTGGGTLTADNLDITTQGGSSAAIRSDRGGGSITVNNGTYETNGSGSPAIYSTADITANNATLVSNAAQAVVVEGKNSVTLNDCDVTGDNTVQNSDKTDLLQAVMLYQSMSGDAEDGRSSFTMNGGTLTSKNAGMFFVTNTVAEINLDNVALNYATDDLLRIQAEGWGNEGENGGQVTLNAKDQSLEGTVTVDENSNLNLYLTGSSDFTGKIENAGKVYVELSDDAGWTLTGDTEISGLTCGKAAVKLNGYTLTVNGVEYTEGTASSGEAIETVVYESHGSGQPEMPPEAGNGKGGPEKDGKPGQAPDGEKPEKPEDDGKDGDKKGPAPDGKDGEKPADAPKDGEKPADAPDEKPGADQGNPPEKPDEKQESTAESTEAGK